MTLVRPESIIRFSATWASIATITTLILMGCYEMDPGRGAMKASFSIDNNGLTCDPAGVTSIKAVLDDGVNSYEATADCADHEIVMENIPSGSYDLFVYGLNDKGVALVDSLEYDDLYADIVANRIAVPSVQTIKLTEVAVQIRARWSVGYYTCKNLDIEDFLIEVMGPDSDKPILEAKLDCTKDGTEEGQFRVVSDKKRELAKHYFDRITIRALGKKKKPLGEAFDVTFDVVENPGEGEVTNPGPGGHIDLSFKCSEFGCYKPGSC